MPNDILNSAGVAAAQYAVQVKEVGLLEFAKAGQILVQMEPSFTGSVVAALAERMGLNYFVGDKPEQEVSGSGQQQMTGSDHDDHQQANVGHKQQTPIARKNTPRSTKK